MRKFIIIILMLFICACSAAPEAFIAEIQQHFGTDCHIQATLPYNSNFYVKDEAGNVWAIFVKDPGDGTQNVVITDKWLIFAHDNKKNEHFLIHHIRR